MKKLVILFFCALPGALIAQNFYFSARVGLANYQGDLQAKKLTLSGAKLLYSFGARYDLAEHITARTYLSMTSLQGDDKKGTASMRMRNLNFKSKVLEWELGAQYNVFSLNDKWWTPYVYAGVGIFNFKPYTNAPGGAKTYLQPLGTEGQGLPGGPKPYKLTQFCIPLGGGVDYALNEDIRVGVEFGYRKLLTDYLDDVSGEYADEAALLAARGQTAVDLAYRGDEVGAGAYPAAKTQRGSKQTDGWYYMSVTVTVRSFIDQYKRIAGLPAYKKDKKVGCPSTRF